MAISPVTPSIQNTAAVQPQKQPTRAKEVENDKDKDDNASKVAAQKAAEQKAAAQAAPRPSVNTSGQVVGSVVNTQA